MASFDDFYKAIKKLVDEDQEATEEEKSALIKGVEGAKPFIDVLSAKDDELALTPEERYVLGYLTEKKIDRLEERQKTTIYDETLIQLVSMMFVHDKKDIIIELYHDENARRNFVKSLTSKDLESIKLSKNDEKVAALLKDKSPSFDDILEIIGFGNMTILYEQHAPKYRTKAIAKEAGAITEAPKNLIIPTFSGYQYSMSLYQDGGAYLQPLTSMDGLQFKKGKLFFTGGHMQEVSEAELRDLRTDEGIPDIDLTALRFLYSILFNQFQLSNYTVLQDIVPVSASIIAGRNNPNKNDIDAALAKVKSYHNVMGVVKGSRNGKPTESYYQVLNFEYYDEKRNIIAFSSPYMNYVIKTIYNLSIRKDKNGKPKLKSSGDPLKMPTHSYLIDASIVKERNDLAKENVYILVTLIERAGGSLPNIKASTLIERNVQLAERLENDPQHRAQQLKRVFTKTWEILQKKTTLTKHYKNLRVSIDKNSDGVLLDELDPKDPTFIPTVKSIKDLCFYFPNEGKEK